MVVPWVVRHLSHEIIIQSILPESRIHHLCSSNGVGERNTREREMKETEEIGTRYHISYISYTEHSDF